MRENDEKAERKSGFAQRKCFEEEAGEASMENDLKTENERKGS